MSKLHHKSLKAVKSLKTAKSLKTMKWIREDRDGVIYEYLPMGTYIVAARGVCGGRPTIKYRRLDARHVLAFFQSGESVQEIATDYQLPIEAVEEVLRLAFIYDYEKSYAPPLRKKQALGIASRRVQVIEVTAG